MSEERKRFDFFRMHAAEIVDLPDGWEIFRWQIVNYGTPAQANEVTGGVPNGVYKKGKNKGHPNWKARDKKQDFSVRFTKRQHEDFLRRWEAKTGLCSNCHGTGQEWAGWSATEGTKYSDCRKCNATGLVAQKEAAA